MRPFLIETLESLVQLFDIYAFTRECNSEAAQIINHLDKKSEIFSGIISQKKCFKTKKGHYLKDLRIVNSHDFKEMIIIDCESFAFSSQIENGICLMPWSGNENDSELVFLLHYLKKLSECSDIREENRNCLHLSELAAKLPSEFVEFLNF